MTTAVRQKSVSRNAIWVEPPDAARQSIAVGTARNCTTLQLLLYVLQERCCPGAAA